MKKRILIATFGSLGDLHPYIPLAHELQRRGHAPVIASFDEHRAAVTAAGVAFEAVRPGLSMLGDKSDIVRRLFLRRDGPEYLVRELFMKHIRASYQDLDRVAAGCDLMVTHPVSFAGPVVAQKRGLPWASSVLAPLSMMSCEDPPVFDPAPWMRSVRALGVGPYRALFALVKRAVRRWEKPLDELRAELGLPPGNPAQFEGQYSPDLNLALFSSVLAMPQADWPVNSVLCGFPRFDGAAPAAATLARLEQFLQAGEAPLVFGLGSSAVLVAGDFWRCAVAAARTLGRRAILLTGEPPADLGMLPPSIAVFDYLPYSAVFPRALAVVHQAGVGTLAQALAAGRPQLITPVAFDQPDNAMRAAALGVARVLPFRKVTAARLAAEIRALLANPVHASRAACVGELLVSEDAAARACDALEALLASVVIR